MYINIIFYFAYKVIKSYKLMLLQEIILTQFLLSYYYDQDYMYSVKECFKIIKIGNY